MRTRLIVAEGGFTYIALLIAIAIIGITASVVGPAWKATARMEKERELLWRGNQFRIAIGRFYKFGSVHGKVNSFPAELKELTEDGRFAGKVRHLRKVYTDPMTGKDDWVLMLDTNQRIIGLHSASDETPMKKDNFSEDDKDFKGKARYSEWVFMYNPVTPQPVPSQPVPPGQPGTPVTPGQPGSPGTPGFPGGPGQPIR